MPIALVSDIHGNVRALAAVVVELERLDVERAVRLGDADDGLAQSAILRGASVSFMRVPWNGR